jgi:hypothetical protein
MGAAIGPDHPKIHVIVGAFLDGLGIGGNDGVQIIRVNGPDKIFLAGPFYILWFQAETFPDLIIPNMPIVAHVPFPGADLRPSQGKGRPIFVFAKLDFPVAQGQFDLHSYRNFVLQGLAALLDAAFQFPVGVPQFLFDALAVRNIVNVTDKLGLIFVGGGNDRGMHLHPDKAAILVHIALFEIDRGNLAGQESLVALNPEFYVFVVGEIGEGFIENFVLRIA